MKWILLLAVGIMIAVIVKGQLDFNKMLESGQIRRTPTS